MSILIKGAKMPTNCKDCDLYRHCDVPFSDEYFKRDSGRPSDCPLVEIPPHGRLIDADKLEDKLFGKMETDGDLFMVLVVIDHVPTVIESEEQEHE